MSNSKVWHKHKDGTWHKVNQLHPLPEAFKYRYLGEGFKEDNNANK